MSKPIIKRVLLSCVLGILLAAIMNEVTFLFLGTESDRAPGEIELVIPAGTADKVALGEDDPAIPANMVFVVGDTLIVKNEDRVDHQLGPLWIPAGRSASLSLSEVQNYVYACSFQSTKYLGLDVRNPLTIGTRVQGILFAGLPLAALIALYSLIVLPVRKPEAA
jgi:hypothetical protein